MKFFLAGLGNRFKNLETITEAVIEADKLGFFGALMPDHYMWGKMPMRARHPVSDDDYVTLESWVTLTYLAGKTEQIRLGTLVTPIPFRPPAMLAKMLSTLDILSKGRVVLGVGAGWSKEEFEGYSKWDEPKVRVDKTKEGLELMIRLWTQEKVTFEGEHYKTKGAVLEPKTIQKPYPPLLFGGRGDRMLKLAGKYADICYLMSRTPEDYEKMKDKVLKAADRTNHTGKIAFMTGDMGSRDPYDSMEYAKKVEMAVETGADYFLTTFPRTELVESMRNFSKEVMPSFN